MCAVEELNLVCEKSAVRPNYDLSGRAPYIKFYFTLAGELILVGEVDNNYIHWLSVTKIDDAGANERIFNHLAGCAWPYPYVSHEYLALRQKGLEYEVLKQAYAARLTPGKEGGTAWETPFGHYYGRDQAENNGRYFAQDVRLFARALQKKCEVRQAGGAYKTILRAYIQAVSAIDFMSYPNEIEPLAGLLAGESYLALSPDKEVRELYYRCREACGQKYNAYMSAVR